MSRVLSLFFVLVVIAIATAAITIINAQGAVLDVSKCTDTIFCRSESCTTQPVASGSCMNATRQSGGPLLSQVIVCNPEEMGVGEIFTFSDKFCTVPTSSRAFICGQCSSHNGAHQQISCFNKNGKQTLNIQECSDSRCSAGCKTAHDLPRGECIATQKVINGIPQTIYLKYDGAILGTSVDLVEWRGTASCQGQFDNVQQLPLDHCIDGTSFKCLYQNSSSKTDLLRRIKAFKDNKKQQN